MPFNLKKSKYPFAEEIGPGWISAMGSAHAMSVLTRAFRHSGKKKYLEAAIKALQPFSLLSNKGGVKALFMGKMTWYEEYPTSYVFHKDHITCNQYGLGFGLVLTEVTMKCRPAPVLKLCQSP